MIWFAPIIDAITAVVVTAVVTAIREMAKKEAPPTEGPPSADRTGKQKKSSHQRKRSR